MSHRRNSTSAGCAVHQELPSLDLHYCKRDQAVRLVTMFLEEQRRHRHQRRSKESSLTTAEFWVSIITGSGKHSQQGPVLRDAIQSLLERRQMVFYLNRGRGSFTVNACSGVEFVKAPLPTDTKVIVTKNQQHGKTQEEIAHFRRIRLQSSAATRSFNPTMSVQDALASSRHDPRPAEVAADDTQISRAQQESLEEQRRVLKEQNHERTLLHRALSESALEERELQQRDKELLAQALENSKQEQGELDDELNRVLSLSQLEHQQNLAQDQRELETILARSTRENGIDDDDVLLQQAIEASQQQIHGGLILPEASDGTLHQTLK